MHSDRSQSSLQQHSYLFPAIVLPGDHCQLWLHQIIQAPTPQLYNQTIETQHAGMVPNENLFLGRHHATIMVTSYHEADKTNRGETCQSTIEFDCFTSRWNHEYFIDFFKRIVLFDWKKKPTSEDGRFVVGS